MHFDVIVLGAGINGLCTAYHLLRRGVRSLAVIERFELGHHRGSSHGKSRITRSTYNSPKYIELIQLAHSQEWPRLSHDSGRRLLVPTPGCFFGPGISSYVEGLRSVEQAQELFRVLEPSEARKRFPNFRFPDSTKVIEDLSCSVVSAEETMEFLAAKILRDATVLQNCPVEQIAPESEAICLQTPRGEIRCDKLVVTAGSWVGKLLPDCSSRFQVAHQDVGYVEVAQAEDFPVWVYCPQEGDSFYGLPSFRRAGAKVARHRTGRENDNPDRSIPDSISESAAAELEEFCARQFSNPAKLVSYEACLYTNTVNEDFLFDFWPRDPRVLVGSACSGHGFKFGPLSGRILSELLLDGKTSLPLFEKYREAFQWSSHRAW